MTHLTEEQLMLYYYGESEGSVGAEAHLGGCEDCRAQYQVLQRVLNSVDGLPVPERSAGYENAVWDALMPRLAAKRRWFAPLPWAAALVAALLAATFWLGRWSGTTPSPSSAQSVVQVRERLLVVAVGDHLERSQLVLVELSNAKAGKLLDISFERRTAEDLLEANRLYRQTAVAVGDTSTTEVLEDLERVLLEIAHSPSSVSAEQLEELRQQIEDRGILLKVKVFSTKLHQRSEL